MGIGNTSSASAILMAYTQKSVNECVGNGTGINSEQLNVKKQLVEKAVARLNQAKVLSDALYVLKELAGFEIVQMVGAILTAAEQGIAVLIDGFIVTSAALIAVKINSNVRDYLIFAHESNENAHQLMLIMLDAKPLLNLDLRLGEGTGAALALPLLRAAASFYNDMASFESAGVTV
jgi:nicotinate-nucleotide--dimethylbenzimidazole phosphoribosyltransferase